MAKQRTSWVVWLRRVCQAAFLILFFWLFLQTAYHPINKTNGPVDLFFDLDPLVTLNAWLASHTVLRAMLFSLGTVVVTVLMGRWFCGWICPFGALHNLTTSLRGTKSKAKLEVGGYSRWQKVKYYLLTGFLAAGILGVNVVGWLDPFSFLYRSLATAIYPALNRAIVSVFTVIYDLNPGVGSVRLTGVTEPVYDVLRKHFLAVEQPYYWGGELMGLLFFLVIGLNFFRARFWCRYICPLGALLGILGKNPLIRLKKNEEQCNNCRLCLVDCQGGASPEKNQDGWKPSECFYCWNCKSDCPSQAIHFAITVPKETKRS